MNKNFVVTVTLVSALSSIQATIAKPDQSAKAKAPNPFTYKTTVSAGEAYILRAQDYLGQKNYTKAAAEYTRAINAMPAQGTDEKSKLERSSALFMRSKCYGNSGDHKKQLADLNQLVSTYPEGRSYNARADFWFEQTQYTKAIADYDKSIASAKSKFDMPLDRRARCYTRMKKFKNAIADLNQYIAINPGMPYGYLERAEAYKQMNDLKSAGKDIQKVKELEAKGARPVTMYDGSNSGPTSAPTSHR